MSYRNSIQKTIATSKFTLPVVTVLSLIIWLTSFGQDIPQAADRPSGLWQYIPEWITSGWMSVATGLSLSILAVYLMAEFNNKFVLLRISSRMLSSTLAVMLTICTFIHSFQPAHIVLVLTMFAYYPLFFSYQRTDSMPMIFIAGLSLSAASLFFPKMLLFAPFFWMAQIILRSFTLRTLCASILGIATPYWMLFSLAYVNGQFDGIYNRFVTDMQFTLPDYSSWSVPNWLSLGLILLTGTVGILNFYRRIYLDKTRTRTYIYVAVVMFAASTLLIMWETAHFNELLPILIINSSILTGHHLAQEYSRLSNIYTIVVCALIAGVTYANYIGL